jgi:hypothetical protein
LQQSERVGVFLLGARSRYFVERVVYAAIAVRLRVGDQIAISIT